MTRKPLSESLAEREREIMAIRARHPHSRRIGVLCDRQQRDMTRLLKRETGYRARRSK